MNSINLSPRLLAIANLVPLDASVIDVGTDHGYLPVWLFQNGITKQVTASDIGKGPLASAANTINEAGAEQGIKLVLCDGLEGIDPDDAEVVVIAGMGGETISGILSRAEWTKSSKKLLLQPMSKSEFLREWLLGNGYIIIDECLVQDSGKLYTIISAKGGKSEKIVQPWELVVSPYLVEKSDPLLEEYLTQQIGKIRRVISGLEKSGSDSNAKRLENRRKVISGLTELRESLKNG